MESTDISSFARNVLNSSDVTKFTESYPRKSSPIIKVVIPPVNVYVSTSYIQYNTYKNAFSISNSSSFSRLDIYFNFDRCIKQQANIIGTRFTQDIRSCFVIVKNDDITYEHILTLPYFKFISSVIFNSFRKYATLLNIADPENFSQDMMTLFKSILFIEMIRSINHG